MTHNTIEDVYREFVMIRGNQRALFALVGESFLIERALYPGSYIDISPSFVFASVTYVDTDRRARAFFADIPSIKRMIRPDRPDGNSPEIAFHHADYTDPIDEPDGSFDLLISQFAGFVSRSCSRYLRPGGLLIANDSHGDAGVAALDPEFQLVATVHEDGNGYRLNTQLLDDYFTPKRHTPVTLELLLSSGKGIHYARSADAYVFTKIK